MNNWIKIAPLTDIPQQGSRVVRTAQGDIAVFRTADDHVYALHDQCPHKGGPLSQGIVFGNKVACPLHGWLIDLSNGQAQTPDEGHTACIPVKLEDGDVYLDIQPS